MAMKDKNEFGPVIAPTVDDIKREKDIAERQIQNILTQLQSTTGVKFKVDVEETYAPTIGQPGRGFVGCIVRLTGEI